MSVFLSIIQLLTILLICIYEYKRKYTSVFLWAALLVMFGIPHFLSVLLGITPYGSEVMIKASFFVICFNLVYFITKLIIIKVFPNYKPFVIKNSNLDKPSMKDKVLTSFLFILLTLSLIILLGFIIRHLGSLMNSSWGNLYTLNGELGFRSPLRYANFLLFASAGVALVFRYYNKHLLFYISIGMIVFYSLLTGNRIIILPAIMAVLIPLVFNKKRSISFKQVVLYGSLACITIYTVYSLRLLRIYGGVYNFISDFNFTEVNNQILTMILTGDGELGLRNAFYHFIYFNNYFENFNQGHTYIRLLLMPIPTGITGGIKPPDFAVSMGSAYISDHINPNFSMHPTLYGDVFANFWWFGILFGAFWAVFTYILDKLINRRNVVIKITLMVLLCTVYIIIARGSVYNGLFIGFVGTIIIGSFYIMSKVRLR
ncbi:O-antigen polymerase [Halalkalibacter nanhaiisediminis]|uniref:Oligosaccharide repeat unit polymerase n=1 Tax=Halalkalibacter nanhaiisediminis TaxID=688079 RepID=A0A562QSZ6_9BACI|nr:O-antigen polymerase [Halalkalibacter nanhaiisediminis]TWI59879.1 hypothetical protein IQ10_00302 [Halalkalibacter nanhaiisediminis]